MFATQVAARTLLIHRAWRYRLKVEPNEVAFLRRHLKRGNRAVDIGAHRGALTYWMLKAVGPAGAVVAVEPIPGLADDLRLLGWGSFSTRLTVVEAALSNSSGHNTLFVPSDGYLGTATFVPQRVSHDRVSVTTTTLDELSGREPFQSIHFIKCDVEGHELEVLRGAESVLRHDRPVLLVESVDCRPAPGQTTRVSDYLQRLGYTGYFFMNGRTQPLADFRVDRHQIGPGTSWCVNFGFVPV